MVKKNIKIVFNLTTINKGMLLYRKDSGTSVWNEPVLRDFDASIARMTVASNQISYTSQDCFDVETSWPPEWQPVAEDSADFCKLFLDNDVLVFQTDTLFWTFPFWRKILFQCGVAMENMCIFYKASHPFVHFGKKKGNLSNPIHSYTRSVLEQINRFSYMLNNLSSEKLVAFFGGELMRYPDTCKDVMASFAESEEVAETLLLSMLEEEKITPSVFLNISKSSNSLADEFSKIQREFLSLPNNFCYNGITTFYDNARQDTQKMAEQYQSFFDTASAVTYNDAEQYFYSQRRSVNYDLIFSSALNTEETDAL